MICARFFSAQKGKFLQIFRKYQKRFSESLRVDFCTDSVLSSQSLRRSAPAPFAQGSHESVQISALCRRENRNKNQGFKTENSRKTQVSHSPSVAPRQLPLGGSLCLRAVFSLYRRENKDKIHGSKLKVCTFFLCGSAVRRYAPSSGRKVSRVSVTEGARGTERRHIFLFLHCSLFPQRLPSF